MTKTLTLWLAIAIIIFLVLFITFLLCVWIFNYYKKYAIESINEKIEKIDNNFITAQKNADRFEIFAKSNDEYKKVYEKFSIEFAEFESQRSKLNFEKTGLEHDIAFTFKKKTGAILKKIPELNKKIKICNEKIKQTNKIYKKLHVYTEKHTKTSDLILNHQRFNFNISLKLFSEINKNPNEYKYFKTELEKLKNQWNTESEFFNDNKFLKSSKAINFGKLETLNNILQKIILIMNNGVGTKKFADDTLPKFFKNEKMLHDHIDIYENFIREQNIALRLKNLKAEIISFYKLFDQHNYVLNHDFIQEKLKIIFKEMHSIKNEIKIENECIKWLQNNTGPKNQVIYLINNLNAKYKEIQMDYKFFERNNLITNLAKDRLEELKEKINHNFLEEFRTIIRAQNYSAKKKVTEINLLVTKINKAFQNAKDLKHEFTPLNNLIDNIVENEQRLLKLNSEVVYYGISLNEREKENIKKLFLYRSQIITKNEENKYNFETLRKDVEKFKTLVTAIEASVGLKIKAYKLYKISLMYFNNFRINEKALDARLNAASQKIQMGQYIKAIDEINEFIEKSQN